MKQRTVEELNNLAKILESITSVVRDETAEELATGTHVSVIKHYDSLRKVMDRVKIAREALSDIADNLSKDIVPELMRAAGVKTITIEGVGRVTVSNRFSCTMIDKELGMKYLVDIGQSGLIQSTVNSSTLSAFAKNMLEEEGKELPDTLFKVGTSPYTSITKV